MDLVVDFYVRPLLAAANPYPGAAGIAACLRAGADVVVTGRVTDASLVVGPGMAHLGWGPQGLDALAGAVVAGHVLECGTQATGGSCSSGARHDVRRPGFPLAELHADGSAVITEHPHTEHPHTEHPHTEHPHTEHPHTGGAVTVGTVTAQRVRWTLSSLATPDAHTQAQATALLRCAVSTGVRRSWVARSAAHSSSSPWPAARGPTCWVR